MYFTQLLGIALGLSPRKVGRARERFGLDRLREGKEPRVRTLTEISCFLMWSWFRPRPVDRACEYLALGGEILEHWLMAHDLVPTDETAEGFRLLALHRQAAKSEPSLNACRETCRELVYHYNLVLAEPGSAAAAERARMMRFVVSHLYLFLCGKLQVAGLGEFCCSSRHLRTESA